ncbi:MAG TPA: hypothetical protein VN255_16680 [Mycobacterium sp.]|nr:hypothetical protein [Mycobacterium sp.]
MLGINVSLDAPPQRLNGPAALKNLTLRRLGTALDGASAALPPFEQQPNYPGELEIKTPLRFPSYSMVLRLIRQMDQVHPLPWTLTAANAAADWSERCGVDYVYRAGDKSGPALRDRAVGLIHINQRSIGVMQGTTVKTRSYIEVVDTCLDNSRMILTMLRDELPPQLRLGADGAEAHLP